MNLSAGKSCNLVDFIEKGNDMKIKAILFDLDGTLLPMPDQDVFVKRYFGLMAQKLAPYGYEPKALIGAIWQGTAAMTANEGNRTNEEVFWEKENASVVAAREHISDPGSAAKLYTERDAKIKSLAGEGEAFEKQLLSGKVKVNVPGVEKAAREVAKAVSSRPKGPSELPVVSKTNLAEEYGMPEATQEATPVVEKSPLPEKSLHLHTAP